MSLLFSSTNEKTTTIARKVFERHFMLDPKLETEYDQRRKMLMYDDILYNLGYLDTATSLNDEKIFTDYAVWIYQLMCHLMKGLGRERIKEQMVLHYQILADVLAESMPTEEAAKSKEYIHQAIKATEKEMLNFSISDRFNSGKYQQIKQEYLDFLFKNDTKGALGVIEQAAKSGVEIEAIYLEILREVMYEVGNLWQQNIITVDKEHYCTSTTQVALAQFYPLIFSKPRIGYKILTCCVGSELHEMGIRMVSDLFEYNGWDSIYLGAAVPKQGILNAIRENNPDLIGLSVTMPQHLPLCLEIVQAINAMDTSVKIAVGGRAFLATDKLWEKWHVDVYEENPMQLVSWATENIVHTRKE
ncbi:MAG: cobalamin-dependent protein [Clostridia bacterium]